MCDMCDDTFQRKLFIIFPFSCLAYGICGNRLTNRSMLDIIYFQSVTHTTHLSLLIIILYAICSSFYVKILKYAKRIIPNKTSMPIAIQSK